MNTLLSLRAACSERPVGARCRSTHAPGPARRSDGCPCTRSEHSELIYVHNECLVSGQIESILAGDWVGA